MSIASQWDEKLKRAAQLHDFIAQECLTIGYGDIRALVDDALELEQLGAMLRHALSTYETQREQAVFEQTRDSCIRILDEGDRRGIGADTIIRQVREMEMDP